MRIMGLGEALDSIFGKKIADKLAFELYFIFCDDDSWDTESADDVLPYEVLHIRVFDMGTTSASIHLVK